MRPLLAPPIAPKGHSFYFLYFHYADSWADPGNQTPPAAWGVTDDVSFEEAQRVAALLYGYTKDFMERLTAAGVTAEWVQIGNEINSGLLWPLGSTSNMENFALITNEGIRAVRETSPDSKIIIHRSSGGETDNCVNYYQNLINAGVTDFDVMGLSFYPYEMDASYALECLENTFTRLYEQFCKDTDREIMVVEIGSNYMQYDGGATRTQGHNMIVNVIKLLDAIPDGKGAGCLYWEIQNYEYVDQRPTIVWSAFTPGENLINTIPVTGLALDTDSVEMEINDAKALNLTYSPTKPDITKLIWTSSNENVATVNSRGMVFGVGEGTATITVSNYAGENNEYTVYTTTCQVTVNAATAGLKNGGFELGNEYWTFAEGNQGTAKISNSDNTLDGSWSLHYSGGNANMNISFYQDITGLIPGVYKLSARVMGDNISRRCIVRRTSCLR